MPGLNHATLLELEIISALSAFCVIVLTLCVAGLYGRLLAAEQRIAQLERFTGLVDEELP